MNASAPARRALAGAAVAVLVVGAGIWWTAPSLLVRGAAERLDSFLPLLTRLIAEDLGAPSETLQSRVRALTRGSDLRLTVIRADGVVLADSERSAEQLERMDNHAGRPEVRAALELGRGEARRRSRTTTREYVYLARRIEGRSGAPHVLRLAQPLRQVPLAAGEQLWLMLLPLAAAALLGAAAGWWADRSTLRPLRRLTARVDRHALERPGTPPGEAPEGPESFAELEAGIERLEGRLQRRAAELAAERDRLLAIVAAVSDGVLVAGTDRRVELVNDAFRELFDTRSDPFRSEPSGPSVLELSRSPGLVGFLERLGAAGAMLEERIDSEGGRALELRGQRLDGGRSLILARDLSDELRLDASRRDLVANVSHELRTPLTAIRGYAENLREGALDEAATARRFVDRILAQCARLEALLGDLLDLSRLERGDDGAAWERREVELVALCERTLETLRGLAEERRIRLTLRAAEPVALDGSPEALERLLVNLVENAIKYNRPGGSVTVELTRSGRAVIVEVADTGLGISPRDLPRIFERFYRVDTGRSRQEGGTGLGLAIVKHAARLHGGRVEVASDLGRGSVFRVVLPDA